MLQIFSMMLCTLLYGEGGLTVSDKVTDELKESGNWQWACLSFKLLA